MWKSDILTRGNLQKDKEDLQNNFDSSILEKNKLMKELGDLKNLLKDIGEKVKKCHSPYELDKWVKEIEELVGEKEPTLNYLTKT